MHYSHKLYFFALYNGCMLRSRANTIILVTAVHLQHFLRTFLCARNGLHRFSEWTCYVPDAAMKVSHSMLVRMFNDDSFSFAVYRHEDKVPHSNSRLCTWSIHDYSATLAMADFHRFLNTLYTKSIFVCTLTEQNFITKWYTGDIMLQKTFIYV